MSDTDTIQGTRAWRHQLSLTSSRGKTRGSCRCGWQHPWVPNHDTHTIVEAHTSHTGLVEHKPKTTI